MVQLRNYRELQVWQKSIQLAKLAYLITSNFPKAETYGMTSQIRRSATSIAANIAEGHARAYTKDYLRFLSIAYGSLAELETHIILAHELNMIEVNKVEKMLEDSSEIGRMLNGLRRSLREKLKPESRTLPPEPLGATT